MAVGLILLLASFAEMNGCIFFKTNPQILFQVPVQILKPNLV